MCLEQGENTQASCWGFTRNTDGTFSTKNNSYSIDLKHLSDFGKFSDYQDIGLYATAGFDGSWLCGEVMLTRPKEDHFYVGCLRFMPKEELASRVDPRFEIGEMKVLTYLEGRSLDFNEAIADLQVQAEQFAQPYETKVEEISPFREFQLHFSLSALAVAASYTSMAVALALLTF
jgi:hypothetical protein